MSNVLLRRQAIHRARPWEYTITQKMMQQAYAERFGVPMGSIAEVPLYQLAACKDDAARRLLLGVSR